MRWLSLLLLLIAATARAEDAMTLERLDTLVHKIDEKAERSEAGNVWKFTLKERQFMLVTDQQADRMRIMTGIAPVGLLSPELMARLLQSNFDSALDARYAVAHDVVWGVFVHPLAGLSDAEFLSGLGQVFNVAASFGTSFSSGMFVYGGGDSQELQRRELIDELLKKGEEKPA